MRTDWEETAFKKLCLDIAIGKHLINRVHTEMETGDPSRGAAPKTKAIKKNNKWIINGRKSYASMAPALDYVIISALIEETGEVGGFLVPCRLEGVHIEENWDTLGMRGTRSDNLIFENVELDVAALVEFVPPTGKQLPLGWLLHIPACYMGIAIAARNEAVRFASVYKPNSLSGPIQEVPEVRRKVGSIDLQLLTARHFLYSVAERWDKEPEKRGKMEAELAAVKYVATNTAVQVVEEAMRIVGGRSLFSSNPMQRYYRDVQAGIYNPPNDDSTISLLANKAFESINDPTSS
ncbi:acyl-CoA dehydrogenase [Aneurinibacillus sp. Ricciae_BoGa-3]|uniref:acyl-CoA dehydrogenase n=1 Tax=Aneurinibacillus sp. Ricciae_BoGa-3 TaxID=3022697 RepID=UPI002FEE4C4B